VDVPNLFCRTAGLCIVLQSDDPKLQWPGDTWERQLVNIGLLRNSNYCHYSIMPWI